MIHQVRTKDLRVIPDERGRLMEMLRTDDDIFLKFGQIYLTAAYPGVVKGWHYHKIQWDHFIVVHGMMKIVLYDSREGSPTRGEINELAGCQRALAQGRMISPPFPFPLRKLMMHSSEQAQRYLAPRH
jgi:dTDP-4-dehydrorhamnose 3,5-epimerase-like enzyme